MVAKAVITASELHRSTGKVLKRVAVDHEHLVVERDGYPVAVMIPYQEYEQITRERAKAALRESVRALGPEAERQGLTEEELLNELKETRLEVFEEQYGDLSR